jgi:6-phosphogluconolactonase
MGKVADIQTAKDPAALAEIAADLFLTVVKGALQLRESCFLALSGGSTPRDMYKVLAQTPYRDSLPWNLLHLFWADERCVPATDRASNFGTAREDFLQAVGIPEQHLHPMPTEPASEDAASAYETVLKEMVPLAPNGVPRLDAVFLGMGEDGHTASLFPGDTALKEDVRWVLPVRGGNPLVDRYTITLPIVNNARHVVFLVSGIPKAPTVKRVLEDDGNSVLPVRLVRPTHGSLTWLLDEEAASLL